MVLPEFLDPDTQVKFDAAQKTFALHKEFFLEILADYAKFESWLRENFEWSKLPPGFKQGLDIFASHGFQKNPEQISSSNLLSISMVSAISLCAKATIFNKILDKWATAKKEKATKARVPLTLLVAYSEFFIALLTRNAEFARWAKNNGRYNEIKENIQFFARRANNPIPNVNELTENPDLVNAILSSGRIQIIRKWYNTNASPYLFTMLPAEATKMTSDMPLPYVRTPETLKDSDNPAILSEKNKHNWLYSRQDPIEGFARLAKDGLARDNLEIGGAYFGHTLTSKERKDYLSGRNATAIENKFKKFIKEQLQAKGASIPDIELFIANYNQSIQGLMTFVLCNATGDSASPQNFHCSVDVRADGVIIIKARITGINLTHTRGAYKKIMPGTVETCYEVAPPNGIVLKTISTSNHVLDRMIMSQLPIASIDFTESESEQRATECGKLIQIAQLEEELRTATKNLFYTTPETERPDILDQVNDLTKEDLDFFLSEQQKAVVSRRSVKTKGESVASPEFLDPDAKVKLDAAKATLIAHEKFFSAISADYPAFEIWLRENFEWNELPPDFKRGLNMFASLNFKADKIKYNSELTIPLADAISLCAKTAILDKWYSDQTKIPFKHTPEEEKITTVSALLLAYSEFFIELFTRNAEFTAWAKNNGCYNEIQEVIQFFAGRGSNRMPDANELMDKPYLVNAILSCGNIETIRKWYQTNHSLYLNMKSREEATNKSSNIMLPYARTTQALAQSDNPEIIKEKTKNWSQQNQDKTKGFSSLVTDGLARGKLEIGDCCFTDKLTEEDFKQFIYDQLESKGASKTDIDHFIENYNQDLQGLMVVALYKSTGNWVKPTTTLTSVGVNNRGKITIMVTYTELDFTDGNGEHPKRMPGTLESCHEVIPPKGIVLKTISASNHVLDQMIMTHHHPIKSVAIGQRPAEFDKLIDIAQREEELHLATKNLFEKTPETARPHIQAQINNLTKETLAFFLCEKKTAETLKQLTKTTITEIHHSAATAEMRGATSNVSRAIHRICAFFSDIGNMLGWFNKANVATAINDNIAQHTDTPNNNP